MGTPNSTRVTLTVDKSTRNALTPILDDFGMDMSTAVNIFFKEIVKKRRFPFEITAESKANDIFSMSTDELTHRVKSAVANRDDSYKPEYTMMIDTKENRLYKLYADGRREYVEGEGKAFDSCGAERVR